MSAKKIGRSIRKGLQRQEKVEDAEEGRKTQAVPSLLSVLPSSTPAKKMDPKTDEKQKISPPKRAPMLASLSRCTSVEKAGRFVVSQDIDSGSSLFPVRPKTNHPLYSNRVVLILILQRYYDKVYCWYRRMTLPA